MERNKIRREIGKLWKEGKKDLNKALKETTRLVKKGEARIREVSEKTEKNVEKMVLSLKREKLYYELGKSLAKLSKIKGARSKKIESLLAEIRGIGRNIKRLK